MIRNRATDQEAAGNSKGTAMPKTLNKRALLRAISASALCLGIFASGLAAAQTAVAKTPGEDNGAINELRVAIPGNVFANMDSHQPSGIFIEALDAVLKAGGFRPVYLRMPTGDAIRELLGGGIHVATVVVPRASGWAGVHLSAPVISEYNVVVVKKDSSLRVDRLDDLRGIRLAGRTGYQYPLLEGQSELHVSRYGTDAEMIRGLLFGREEALVFSAISDLFAFRAEGVSSRLKVLDRAVGVVPLVAAFSAVRFSSDQVRQIDAAIAEFKTSPAWQSILDRNGMSDLVKDWPLVNLGK